MDESENPRNKKQRKDLEGEVYTDRNDENKNFATGN